MLSGKKLGALVALSALMVGAFAGSTFAQTNGGEQTPPASTAPLDKLDPAVQAKMESIIQLRSQQQAIEAQLKAQHQVNVDLSKQLREEVGGTFRVEIKHLRELLKQDASAREQFEDQIKAVASAYKAAKQQKDEASQKGLKAEMEQLRTVLKAESAKRKEHKAQLQQFIEQYKAKRPVIKQIHDRVQALRGQAIRLHEAIDALRAEKAAAWAAFHAARNAKDVSGMTAALDTVIAKKQAIMANLQKVLAIETDMTAVLQATLQG